MGLCKYRNDVVDDVIQDLYIEVLTTLKGNELSYEELKKIAKKIAFTKYYDKFSNPASPISNIPTGFDGDDSDFVWNFIPSGETSALDETIYNEKILSDKSFQGKWIDLNILKNFIHTLNFKSGKQFKDYISNNFRGVSNIPKNPDIVYHKNGWSGWRNFLGTDIYLSYDDCKAWVQLNLVPKRINSSKAYTEYGKKNPMPKAIPKSPWSYYINKGWIGTRDFFGCPHKHDSSIVKKQTILDYNNAKKYVQKFLVPKGISGLTRWAKNKELIPYFLPKNPFQYYSKKIEWDSLDFFGTKYERKYPLPVDPISFKEAREWVRLNLRLEGITSYLKWRQYINGEIKGLLPLPTNIPLDPVTFYKKTGEWTTWGDWLGTNRIANKVRNSLSYKEAKFLAQKELNGKKVSGRQWMKLNHDQRIPRFPDRVFKNKGWKGWNDWLGVNNSRNKYHFSYKECRQWVAENIPNIKNFKQWTAFAQQKLIIKRPVFIPKRPDVVFNKNGWKNWHHFLQIKVIKKLIKKIILPTKCKITIDGRIVWVYIKKINGRKLTGHVVQIFDPLFKTKVEFDIVEVIEFISKNKEQTKILIDSVIKIQSL
jgi:hypothetical protein